MVLIIYMSMLYNRLQTFVNALYKQDYLTEKAVKDEVKEYVGDMIMRNGLAYSPLRFSVFCGSTRLQLKNYIKC